MPSAGIVIASSAPAFGRPQWDETAFAGAASSVVVVLASDKRSVAH